MGDARMILTSTVGVVILAWVVTHASDINKITTGAATAFTAAIGPLNPKQ